MKKRLYALTLLALIGVGVSVVTGCDIPEEEETPEYTISITNKDELLEEWHLGDTADSSRVLDIEITHLGETQNPVSAISSGELVISSSNTDVITTSGSYIYSIGEGNATISATYHDVSDSVELTVLERRAVEADWEVGGTYVLGFEYNGVAYYADGNLKGNYSYEGTCTTDLDQAAQISVGEGDGANGFYLTFDKSGTKYYICIINLNGYQDMQYTTTPTLIYWDTLNQIWTNEAGNYFLAYNSNYDCIWASSVSDWLGSAPAVTLYPLTGIPGAGSGSSYGTAEVKQYESGASYLLGFDTGSDRYYATGAMSSYYGATTTDYNSAIYFTINDVNDGVTLSATISGATKYVTMQVNDTHYNLVYSETSQTLTYDATYNTFTVTSGDTKVFLGTYGQNTTLGWSNYSYISQSGEYPAHLYEVGEEESSTTTLPDPASWSVGNKYALGYQKGNTMHYYDGGVLQSFYGSVTTDLSKAAPVLVEAANDGYTLKLENNNYLGYAYELGNNGSYHNDFKWDLTEPFVWTYDESLNTFVTVHDTTTYAMGTSSSFDEITMVDVSNSSNYIAHLYDLAN